MEKTKTNTHKYLSALLTTTATQSCIYIYTCTRRFDGRKQMGKASKWLQKLWTRKREDKEENKATSFSLEDSVLPTAIFPGTPNQKRRWSFGKSTAITNNYNHKTSRSLDAIDSTRLVPLDLLGYRSEKNHGANHLVTFFVAAKYENEQKVTTTVPVPHNEVTYTVVSTPFAASKQFRALGDAAATKIQAFFRAHLVNIHKSSFSLFYPYHRQISADMG